VLLLAIAGADAMRRLRDALAEHGIKPRQLHLLGVLSTVR
jgi:uncharacterized protein YjbK